MPNKTRLASMGKKITAKAKAIRRAHPSIKWPAAMRKAGKSLKGKL